MKKYKHPKVTVIMYVKNGAPYFRRALDSVVEQTLRDIEVLIVDGGSTDGTLEIAEEMVKRDGRVRILTCEKGSVGAQFNLGVREAKGEYIGIVESDDYILPTMYETEYLCAKENDCDVLRADNYIFFNLDEQEVRIRTKVSHDPSTYGNMLQAGRDDDKIQIGGSYWTGLYRKSYLLEHKILMNESKGAAYQDFGFLFLASAMAGSVYFLDDAFYCYRKDNLNSSCNRPADIHMVLREYDFLKKELVNRGLWERLKDYYYLWKIRNERWFYYNLNRTDQERFIPYFYQDLRSDLSELYTLEEKWNIKEKKLVVCSRESEKSFRDYLKELSCEWDSARSRLLALNKKDAVYLFGAGNIGKIMHQYLLKQGMNIKGFIDNNPELWGAECDGIKVFAPDDVILDETCIFLICSENYADEIKKELLKREIGDSQMIICNDMDACVRFIMHQMKG